MRVFALALLLGASLPACAGEPPPLRVCADPNNLPYSNQQGEGFENAIARMLARDLHRKVAYTWFPQRRGFVRNTLKAGLCDVVMGVPQQMEMLRTTHPYYRSSYAFVTRRADRLRLRGLDDPRLRRLRIGVHAVGDDYSNVPPAMALARRGIVDNIRGYSIYGDYSKPDPTRALVDAVARGEVDVAIAWGPIAGYFAQREPQALDVLPVAGPEDPDTAMRFDISMGVRRDDAALGVAIDDFIARRADAIAHVLARYGVPVVPADGNAAPTLAHPAGGSR